MPKLKNSKSAMKRFKISAKGKFLHRKTRQNHFNARVDSKATRHKRKQDSLAKAGIKGLDNLMPYL